MNPVQQETFPLFIVAEYVFAFVMIRRLMKHSIQPVASNSQVRFLPACLYEFHYILYLEAVGMWGRVQQFPPPLYPFDIPKYFKTRFLITLSYRWISGPIWPCCAVLDHVARNGHSRRGNLLIV